MRAAIAFVALAALCGCGVAVNEAPETLDEANRALEPIEPPAAPDMAPYLDPVLPEYRIGPGDRVSVDVAGLAELSREAQLVRSDGRITLFVIEDVEVAGLTTMETARTIESKLAPLVEKPQVVVTLIEARSQRFMVLGAVGRPGVYDLPGPLTVLEALALAGGLSTDPSGKAAGDVSRAYLLREEKLVPVRFSRLFSGDRTQNVYVHPGDMLYVPPAWAGEVYVLGQVQSPTVIDMHGELTLMQALARAGWVTKEAKESAVRVIRGSLLDPKVYLIDAEDIGAGKARDVALAPGDIVFVTTTEIADYNEVINAIMPTLSAAVSARYMVDGVSGIFINSGN